MEFAVSFNAFCLMSNSCFRDGSCAGREPRERPRWTTGQGQGQLAARRRSPPGAMRFSHRSRGAGRGTRALHVRGDPRAVGERRRVYHRLSGASGLFPPRVDVQLKARLEQDGYPDISFYCSAYMGGKGGRGSGRGVSTPPLTARRLRQG